jgi:hypothetical protein
MEEKDIHSELASIRLLMERSARFISLSGLSGVLAGVYALIGAFTAYQIVFSRYQGLTIRDTYADQPGIYHQLFFIAVAVLLLSVGTCIWLSIRQAIKKGESYWNPVSRRLLTNMAIPLFTGGSFILILLLRAQYELIASACLLFYGLALIAGSHYTYTVVAWLGAVDIILGLIAALVPEHGPVLWITGFGLLHIIYGSFMHFKYKQ